MKKFIAYLGLLHNKKTKLTKTQRYLSALGIITFLAVLGTLPIINNQSNRPQTITNAQAADTDYYVSPSGSDTNTGTQSAPYRTINKAVSVVTAGGTVHVAPGTYDEALFISQSGTASARIRIVSDVKWDAKIAPTHDNYAVTIRGHYIDFDGFEITTGTGGFLEQGLWVHGGNDIVSNNKIHNINRSGSANGSALGNDSDENGNSVFDGNVIYDVGHSTLDHGIYLASGPYITVKNNVVGYTTGYGINMWHLVHNEFIYNNTLFYNGKSGICVGAGDHPESDNHDTIVANNIAYRNGEYGFMEWGSVHNNTYFNNLTYANYLGSTALINGTQTGTINTDPLFVNYKSDGSGDYHLEAGSPAINKANALYAPLADAENKSRNGVPDIGAYEYGGGSSDTQARPD